MFFNKLRAQRFNLLFNLLFAIFTISTPILFYESIFLSTTILIFISIIGLIKWKSLTSLFIFIFGAISGVASEIIAIHFGVWSYAVVNFMNVPIWLFLVWGNASAFIYQTTKEFNKIFKNSN